MSYTLLFKDMAFQKKVLPEIPASLAGSVTSLLLAAGRVEGMGIGEWRVDQRLVRYDPGVSSCPWRPSRLQFVRSMFREMFGYGKHIAVSQILIFGITNIDDMFVGRMLGQAALGQYGLRLQDTPTCRPPTSLHWSPA